MQAFQEKQMRPGSKFPFGASIRTKSCATGKAHWHIYMEILYILEGHVIVDIEGEEYQAEPGDLIVINALQIHLTKFAQDVVPAKIVVIQFDPSLINPCLSSVLDNTHVISFFQKEIMYTSYIKAQDNLEIKRWVLEIANDFTSKEPAFELRVKGGIYYLLAWLIQYKYITMKIYSNNFEDIWRLHDVFEYMECNFGQEISSQMAAKMICMSHNHFCRLFKKTTGKTFTEYLNSIRISEAEKLIVASNDNIYQIAEKCGFSSYNYLTRLFTKSKGMSPHKYRKLKKDEYQSSE